MTSAPETTQAIFHKLKHWLRYWPVALLTSIAWYYLFVAVWLANRYGVYSPRGLVKYSFALPFFFLASNWLAQGLLGRLGELPKGRLRRILLACAAVALVMLALAPLPWPAVRQAHRLQIISNGSRNPAALGAVIEIRQVRALDESPVPWQAFKLSGDWQIKGDRLVSEGRQPGSIAELEGQVPAGVVLSLRYNDNAGVVTLIWDETQTQSDLYADRGVTVESALYGLTSKPASAIQFIYLGLSVLLIYAALISILLVFGLVFELKLLNRRLSFLLLAGLYLVFFNAFVQVKQSYTIFSEERAARDTYLYAKTAEAPLNSWEFWAGERPFTLPLEFKLLGINTQNYINAIDRSASNRVSLFQTWLSILCWTCLGLAFSARLRTPWLRPFAFGLIVFFSLNLEVSIWDSLLISESVSFSMLALLLAAWLAWELIPERWFTRLVGVVSLLVVVLVSELYSYARESNPYFLLVGAAIFALALLTRRVRPHLRGVILAYVVVLLTLFVLQNVSFSRGNRWQIHIYDHLARRILENASARDYFVNAGLPLNPDLMKIVDMGAPEYQDYLMYDPRMEALRQWVDQKGGATLISYLLSHPRTLFLEPLQHGHSLLNGSNLEYQFPRYAVQNFPIRLQELTRKFYPHSPLVLWSFAGLILAGLTWALTRRPEQTAWLVIAVMYLSLYPLMVIVWNGNPLEIERHAAQLGIQFRLAAWMAVGLVLDHMAFFE
jgi:hypothetical protein